MEGIVITVLVVTALASAVFTATVAEAKGYDRLAWGTCGLLFGIVALIAIAGMPLKAHAVSPPQGESIPAVLTKNIIIVFVIIAGVILVCWAIVSAT